MLKLSPVIETYSYFITIYRHRFLKVISPQRRLGLVIVKSTGRYSAEQRCFTYTHLTQQNDFVSMAFSHHYYAAKCTLNVHINR